MRYIIVLMMKESQLKFEWRMIRSKWIAETRV